MVSENHKRELLDITSKHIISNRVLGREEAEEELLALMERVYKHALETQEEVIASLEKELEEVKADYKQWSGQ